MYCTCKLWWLRWRVGLVTACQEIFQFSAGDHRPENCPSVSDDVLISGGRLFHANGPATEKLHGPKPVVRGTSTCRSPWSAESKWRRVETAETGLIIDTRYGAASSWRHLYTSIQILTSSCCHTGSQRRSSRMAGMVLSHSLFLTHSSVQQLQ